MIYRNEYPRPQFVRDQWQNLNGEWNFSFDDNDAGMKGKWYQNKKFSEKIQVPFAYQTELSGIGSKQVHEIVWYNREFTVVCKENQNCLIHFGAVDYESDVFVNGQHVGKHIGGHTSFSLDITNFLNDSGKQSITVRAFDPHDDETIPRGKQFWKKESAGIWYTNTTGIWQTVWLEVIDKKHIQSVKLTPNLDNHSVQIEALLSNDAIGGRLNYQIKFKNEFVVNDSVEIIDKEIQREVDLFGKHIFPTGFHGAEGWTWSPENPNLFDIDFQITEGEIVVDSVQSYFGMRKVHTEKGMVFLNDTPYYQKLVLDQGYWKDGLLTAPKDQDYIQDIELAKKMGFNGCRKHQKVEDPRFLYWADQLGFIVWGECASAPVYSNQAVGRLTTEWIEIIERDYNHPCILTWVPLNESWGVPEIHSDRQQQDFSKSLYNLLHALDKTRLVISNDGWEMTETDIVAIHNYAHGKKAESKKYEQFQRCLSDAFHLIHLPGGRFDIFAKGYHYKGQPILLTEFGGIGYKVDEQEGWGYTSVSNGEEFLLDYSRIMDAVYASEGLWGYCYTQLTDVEQEINGLLSYDRKPKVSIEKIREINDQYHAERIHIE